MNKLKTYPGGHPFTTDDILYNYNAIASSLAAFAKSFGSEYIFFGCEIVTLDNNNGTETIQVTEGAVYLRGEIFRVAASSYTYPISESKYFDLFVDYDPLGNKRYADNILRDTYERRTAKLYSASTIPVGALPINSAIRLSDQIPDLWASFDGYYTKDEADSLYALEEHTHASAPTLSDTNEAVIEVAGVGWIRIYRFGTLISIYIHIEDISSAFVIPFTIPAWADPVFFIYRNIANAITGNINSSLTIFPHDNDSSCQFNSIGGGRYSDCITYITNAPNP